uniref:Uncharacterized protein n=1 Tax=Anguilla anguilla TaxID=7936 RepID=A0A0E9UHH9_ANGAN
MGLLCIYWGSC